METFAPNSNLEHARRLRAILLLVMGVCLLFAFGLLAAGVDDHRLMTEWDAQAKDSFYRHAVEHRSLQIFFTYFTHLGAVRILLAASVLVTVVLLGLRCGQLAGIWLVTTIGGFKIIDILKDHYERARPAFLDPLVLETSRSFPSGHATGSALFYSLFAYLLIRATRYAGWGLTPFFLILIGLIGFSRIYLGAHWFSDVIGGFTLGFGLASLGAAAAEYTRQH